MKTKTIESLIERSLPRLCAAVLAASLAACGNFASDGKTTYPEEEIDKVTTPMGCTIQGLNEMEHQGLSSSLIRGIVVSYEKIGELKTMD